MFYTILWETPKGKHWDRIYCAQRKDVTEYIKSHRLPIESTVIYMPEADDFVPLVSTVREKTRHEAADDDEKMVVCWSGNKGNTQWRKTGTVSSTKKFLIEHKLTDDDDVLIFPAKSAEYIVHAYDFIARQKQIEAATLH